MKSQILRMLIVGAPGSGKGTIASRIVRDFGLLHLSSGDLLRAQIAAGTKAGIEAKRFIGAGTLVPDEPMTELIVAELQKLQKSWLLDGKMPLGGILQCSIPFLQITTVGRQSRHISLSDLAAHSSSIK